jgi:hypothetical protein
VYGSSPILNIDIRGYKFELYTNKIVPQSFDLHHLLFSEPNLGGGAFMGEDWTHITVTA